MIHNIQEATTVNDVARNVPRIYAVVEDRQADHQASVVEVEGKIAKQYVSILIDPRSNISYVAPQIVDSCALQKCKHKKSWLVQLATRTKRKVSELVEACPLEMNG
jgi:rRNA processing protein Gar1